MNAMTTIEKVEYRFIPVYTKDDAALSDKELEAAQNKSFMMYEKFNHMNEEYLSPTVFAELLEAECGFQIEAINRVPYKKDNCTLISLKIAYCNRGIDYYIENGLLDEILNVSEMKSIYKPWNKK